MKSNTKQKERLEVLTAFACKEFDNALHLAKQYLNTYENDIYMLIWLGYIYKTLKEYDNAVETYDYVLSIDSMNIDARLDLLDLYIETKQYDVAKPILDEIFTNPIYSDVLDKRRTQYEKIRNEINNYLEVQELMKINA